jgi:hypothetical protein
MKQNPCLNLYQLKNSEDKFILEFSNNNDDNKNKTTKVKKRRTELTIGGDIACFVKPHSDFVCDTIVRGILPN